MGTLIGASKQSGREASGAGAARLRVLMLLAACAVSVSAEAQTLPPGCDAKLRSKTADARETPDAYRERGTKTQWCEGIYSSLVGNMQLELDAIGTPDSTDADAAALDTIVLRWRAPAGTKVRLQARQILNRAKPYYQLDAEVTTGADGTGRFAWPAQILKRYDMWPLRTTVSGDRRGALVTVQGWATIAQQTVYIPVHVAGRSTSGAMGNRVEFVMRSESEVFARNITVERLMPDGSRSVVKFASRCPSARGGGDGVPVMLTACMPPTAVEAQYLMSVQSDPPATVRFWYAPPKP